MPVGTRKKDDPLNTHDTGYHHGDLVEVLDEGNWVKGVVYAIQAKGPKVDVHIGHVGHKNNGRVVTVGLDDVRPAGKQETRQETKQEGKPEGKSVSA
jgi:hypothetical protein